MIYLPIHSNTLYSTRPNWIWELHSACTTLLLILHTMARHGKKYAAAVKLVDRDRLYTMDEAVDLLMKTHTVKFDQTVEIHLNLAIDPKYADQMVRSTISLPNGS